MDNDNALSKFDYSQLDEDTSEFLKTKENNLREIAAKAATDVGRKLSEAQDKLSNHRNGIFQDWYESMGFKKQNVYNLIDRYKFIVQNLDNFCRMRDNSLFSDNDKHCG